MEGVNIKTEKNSCEKTSNDNPLMVVKPKSYMYIIGSLAMLGSVICYLFALGVLWCFFMLIAAWYIYKMSIRVSIYNDRIEVLYIIGIKKRLRYEDIGLCLYKFNMFSKLKIKKGERYFIRVDYQYENYMNFVYLLWEKRLLSLWSVKGINIAREKGRM